MKLPLPFVDRMKEMLDTEAEQFFSSLEGSPYMGLRANTLKVEAAKLKELLPFCLKPVPWCEEGYYYQAEERPAKNPYYQAGLFYLQEPSAMAPGICLGVKPHDKVLDLCAAPGGKSTHIAARLKGEGLLVSNDNSQERTIPLILNLELWGTKNCVVTNEEPERLARYFPDYFDRILVDAPCSGEGMFRKDAKAVKSWADYSGTVCTAAQADILEWSLLMLKPGGRLLYSTCTFNPEENEQSIARFLTKHPEVHLVPLPDFAGWSKGQVLWAPDYPGVNQELSKTRRLWPHKIEGEGHFLALLQKEDTKTGTTVAKENEVFRNLLPEAFTSFMEENFFQPISGTFVMEGHSVYKVPAGLPSLKGLKVQRPGWHMGVIKNNRFQPSHALALAVKRQQAVRTLRLEPGDEAVKRYLKGETLMVDGPKGWTLVCLGDFPLGWGKQAGGYLKNHYPPGRRLTV